ncbi:MAG: hypothetical protein LWX83_15460, partial [Anaerolineae bacterium]|nr:hypothetical protein [Anaerolineae bacterium]
MVNQHRLFRLCFLGLVLLLMSACSPSAAPAPTPTPNPADSPEYYVQKYASNISVDRLGDDSLMASAVSVDNKAVATNINLTVYNESKMPRLMAGEGGTALEIPKIGDQAIAYQAADGTDTTVLDFTKGNVQVHLSAYLITGGEAPLDGLVKLAQDLEKSLPARLPVQALALPSTAQINSLTFNEYIKQVELGKQVATGSIEIKATKVFAPDDVNHCLNIKLNQRPETLQLALYDDQQQKYLSKSISVVNPDEEKAQQITR